MCTNLSCLEGVNESQPDLLALLQDRAIAQIPRPKEHLPKADFASTASVGRRRGWRTGNSMASMKPEHYSDLVVRSVLLPMTDHISSSVSLISLLNQLLSQSQNLT